MEYLAGWKVVRQVNGREFESAYSPYPVSYAPGAVTVPAEGAHPLCVFTDRVAARQWIDDNATHFEIDSDPRPLGVFACYYAPAPTDPLPYFLGRWMPPHTALASAVLICPPINIPGGWVCGAVFGHTGTPEQIRRAFLGERILEMPADYEIWI